MTLQPLDRVLATIRLRPMSPAGGPLRPQAHLLEGQQLEMVASWQQEQDERYPGEWALTPTLSSVAAFSAADIIWIASGDVIIDKVLSRPEAMDSLGADRARRHHQ